jgi:quinol monooxygenase YgiN
MAEQCRNDPGCRSCHIYQDLQEKNVIMLEEIWRAEEDLDLHLRSGEYLNLLLVLEMSLKQPEIRFDTISSSAGIGPGGRWCREFRVAEGIEKPLLN